MANVLAVAKQHAIIVLAQLGRSQRQIAAQLGIDRSTVKRYIDRERAENAPKPVEDSKPTISIAGFPGRPSKCQPHEAVIKAALDRGLSGQRIWQDLQSDHDFKGSCQSVRRFIRKLGTACPVPFRRMECEPGEEAQIDFGTGAPIITPDGKRRRTHVLRVVLSHSRKAYSEVVFRQTTEDSSGLSRTPSTTSEASPGRLSSITSKRR